jgi:transcriptional regulator with XRE-family HTH domain
MGTGKKIRHLREEKRMTIHELAKEAKISPSFLSEIETELKIPSNNIIEKVAKALGINPDNFQIYKIRSVFPVLARSFDNIDEDKLEKIIKIIKNH